MNLVLARPFDDDTVIAFSVHHRKQKITFFETAFEEAKEKVKTTNQETWTLGQILEELKVQGWIIHQQDVLTTVTY